MIEQLPYQTFAHKLQGHLLDITTVLYFEKHLKQRWSQINDRTRIYLTKAEAVSVSVKEFHPSFVPRTFVPNAGVKAYLWRLLGSLLNDQSIYQNGTQTAPAVVPMPAAMRRLDMETFALFDDAGSLLHSLTCCYDALGDVLYIQDASDK